MSALISILRAAKVIPFSLSVDNQELNSTPLWVLQMVEEEVFKLFATINTSYTALIFIRTNYIASPFPPLSSSASSSQHCLQNKSNSKKITAPKTLPSSYARRRPPEPPVCYEDDMISSLLIFPYHIDKM